MKISYFLLFTVVALLTGCVSNHTRTPPKVQFIKSPPVNLVSSASLGERMLESGKVTTVDGFTLYDDVRIFDGYVKAGNYVQIGVHGRNKVFGPQDGYGTGLVGALSGVPSPAKAYVDADTGNLCFLGAFATRFCSDVKPDIVTMNIYSPDSFMQELIYTGKVGDKIRFTYREFQNGMARGAFNIDVEYDLSESNLISYKGATVKIISATNQKIVYEIQNHFN